MPFASRAKLTIENQSGKRIESLRVRLDVEPLEQIPTNWGRFHTTWTESPAATDKTPLFVNGIPSGPARRIGTPLRLKPPIRIDRGLAVGTFHAADTYSTLKMDGKSLLSAIPDHVGIIPLSTIREHDWCKSVTRK